MALGTTTQEVKFTNNELWCAMESQVMDLVSDRAIQYLTKEAVETHVRNGIDAYFNIFENPSKEYEDLHDFDFQEASFNNEGFMQAVMVGVQLVLEEVLPQIHLKPEWEIKSWENMVNKKKKKE